MASEASPGTKLMLTDVYRIAEKVGEQFQQLIQQFGAMHLSSVVTTVVSALEHLEYFVDENHQLEIANKKLQLQVDSLACEKEQRMKLTNELDDFQLKLEREIEDKKRLGMRIERLMMRNEDLAKQLDRLKGTALKPVPVGQDPLAVNDKEATCLRIRASTSEVQSSLDIIPNGSVVDSNDTDRLQFPRMSKRLSQVELELTKTRRKLVETHHSLQNVSAENRSLKAQLDESRAEAALNELETSRSSSDSQKAGTDEEAPKPKFYKKDLLAVLCERNELKEELDGVREELDTAREEIKKLQEFNVQRRGSLPSIWLTRPRSTTRVREILDSITESITIEQPESNTS